MNDATPATQPSAAATTAAAAATALPFELRLNTLQHWRELTQSTFLSLDCSAARPAAFSFSALMARFGNSVAAEICVSESKVVRHRTHAENSSAAYFKLVWQLSGQSRVQQGAHDSLLETGMWSVYDTTRPYAFSSSERSRFMVLLVPQLESVGWTPAVAALAGKALPRAGASHIVLSGLATMLRDGTPLDDESQITLQDSTVALLERALESQARTTVPQLGSDGAARLSRVQAYILERLADPALTPESIAQAFGMSRRTLYNLFLAGHVTPRAFIQQARLERARHLIAQPQWRSTPLAQIAKLSGFADAAHFCRTFQAHQGVSPSTYRERVAASG